MTRIVVKRLIWDDWNIEHIKKHNVSQEEVEAIGQKLLAHVRGYSNRYILIGRVGSRMISVIVSRKGLGLYYPITARDSDKKERRKVHEKEKKQNS